MTTDTDICNRALQAAGARSSISNLSEVSNEAQNCVLIYDNLRRRLLRAANWSFAGATAPLTLLKAAPGTPENPSVPANTVWSTAYPAPPWLYAYAYPTTDCIRFRAVKPQPYAQTGALPVLTPVTQWMQAGGGPDQPSRIAWRLAADTDAQGNPIKVILTDLSQALGWYTRNVTALDATDDQFQRAFVAALAAELSIPLSGDKKLRAENIQIAREMIAEARAEDGNEGLRVLDIPVDWLQARGGFGVPSGLNAGQGWDSIAIAGVIV